MSPVRKLGLYGLLLLAALGGGAAVGSVVGPIDTSGDDTEHPTHEPDAPPTTVEHDHRDHGF